MSGLLRDLEVLVLDCQASGATPVLGDLLELGWGLTSATANVVPPRADWIVPASKRRVSARPARASPPRMPGNACA